MHGYISIYRYGTTRYVDLYLYSQLGESSMTDGRIIIFFFNRWYIPSDLLICKDGIRKCCTGSGNKLGQCAIGNPSWVIFFPNPFFSTSTTREGKSTEIVLECDQCLKRLTPQIMLFQSCELFHNYCIFCWGVVTLAKRVFWKQWIYFKSSDYL